MPASPAPDSMLPDALRSALRDAQAQWEGTGGGQGAAFWRAELLARQQQQQIVLRDILARLEQERAGRSSQGGGQV